MCQVAVTDLATAGAALRTGFAGGEGREVVVQQKTFGAMFHDIVDDFLIELSAEGHRGERLCLAAGEEGRAVGSRHEVHLAPDGPDLVGLTSVETLALVEDGAAHRLFLHVVVIPAGEGSFGITFLFGQ